MLKGKLRVAFRLIIALVFMVVGGKYCIEGDYLFGAVSIVAGAAFIVSLFRTRHRKKD
jgi:hypothetical protein